MPNFVYLFFLALVLLGCASQPQRSYYWEHDKGGDSALLRRDQGACEAQALGQHPLMPVQQGIAIYGSCMRSKGWILRERGE